MNKKKLLYLSIILIFILTGCNNIGTKDNALNTTIQAAVTNIKETNNQSELEKSTTQQNTYENMRELSKIVDGPNELNLLIYNYSVLLDKSIEIGKLNEFIKSVSDINQSYLDNEGSSSCLEQGLIVPTNSLTDVERKKLNNGEIIKLRKDGVSIDLDFDGIEEALTFCYDPTMDQHQEYILRINNIEVSRNAIGLTGDVYAVILGDKEKRQIYILIEENGPHNEIPFTYIWSYWNDSPYYVDGVYGSPKAIDIVDVNGVKLINTYEGVILKNQVQRVTAIKQIQFIKDKSGNEYPSLVAMETPVSVTTSPKDDVIKINEPKKNSSTHRTEQQILDKAVTMKNFNWIPKKDLMGFNEHLVFKKGTTQIGIPYSQNTNCDEIEFSSKLNESDFYQNITLSKNDSKITSPRYGVDCAGFVSFALGVDVHTTIEFIAGIEGGTFSKVGSYDVNNFDKLKYNEAYLLIAAGDAMAWSDGVNGHTILVVSNSRSSKEIVSYEMLDTTPVSNVYTYEELLEKMAKPFRLN